MPAMSAMTVKEGFQLFDQFLKSVAEAVVEAKGDLSMKFRDRISSTTKPIFSQSEEEFELIIDSYNCLIAYRRSRPHQ